jgi:hypothetical protein
LVLPDSVPELVQAPSQPTPPPREMTSRVSMRIWFDPRVRFWVIVAGFLLLLFSYFSLLRILEWRQEWDLIRHGTLVTATVGMEGIGRSGYVIPPGNPVTLSFNSNGQAQQVSGNLEGHASSVSTGETIQIRIDPNDPTRWTDMSEPRGLGGDMIGPLLLLPIVPIALLVAWLKRRRLILAWTGGPAEAAVVAGRHQTALAPMAHVIKCSFRDREDKRLFVVYLPRAFSKLKSGDVIWLLASPQKAGPAIAAAWLE